MVNPRRGRAARLPDPRLTPPRWGGPPWHNAARWDDRRFNEGRWQEEFLMRPPNQFRMSRTTRLLLPVLISLLLQLPAALFWLVRHPSATAATAAALAVVGPLALLGIRRFPGPVVAIVSLAACADFLLSGSTEGPPFVALAFAIVLSVARGARVWAWLSVAVFWVGTVVSGILLNFNWHPARIAITTLGILVVFGIGEGIRTRRENMAEFRRIVAQRKQSEVQAERVRIARELHDVLAHSLSQINVQAGVGLHLMQNQPDKAAEALASIKETSKTALDEVRSVLGILRAEGGRDPEAPLVPEPDLSRLPGLAASVSEQGVDVQLNNAVTEAPQSVQLAIYRIVQESLTNVVRHSGADRATVTVGVDRGSYLVTVTDNGSGTEGGVASEGGRGLLGMRERAELLGGSLTAGPSSAGRGFEVVARIPIKEHE